MSQLIFGAFTTSNILGLSVIVKLDQPPVPISQDFPLVFYYAGWSLPELEKSPGAKNYFQAFGFGLDEHRAEPGFYAVRLKGLPTNVTWDQSLVCPDSADDWKSCPVAIAAVGILLPLLTNRPSFLQGFDVSCAEPLQSGHRIALRLEQSVVSVTSTMQIGFNGKIFPTLKRIECKKLG